MKLNSDRLPWLHITWAAKISYRIKFQAAFQLQLATGNCNCWRSAGKWDWHRQKQRKRKTQWQQQLQQQQPQQRHWQWETETIFQLPFSHARLLSILPLCGACRCQPSNYRHSTRCSKGTLKLRTRNRNRQEIELIAAEFEKTSSSSSAHLIIWASLKELELHLAQFILI